MCVAAAIAGGTAAAGLAGSAISASGAKSAANTQADAANNAAQMQMQQFQQIQQNLQPYMQLGQSSIPALQQLLNGDQLNTQFSFNPTQQQLEQTPGYQFTLQQGMKNTNNALAAKGLNLSGAQAKGIAGYTTGLADQTYQQQYQNALQTFMTNYNNRADNYNRLAGLVGLGQNAAAGVGNAGMTAANNAGNYLTQGANAQAAGTIGTANAINSGLGSLSGGGLMYSMMNQGNGSNIYGSSGGGTVGVPGWTPAGS